MNPPSFRATVSALAAGRLREVLLVLAVTGMAAAVAFGLAKKPVR